MKLKKVNEVVGKIQCPSCKKQGEIKLERGGRPYFSCREILGGCGLLIKGGPNAPGQFGGIEKVGQVVMNKTEINIGKAYIEDNDTINNLKDTNTAIVGNNPNITINNKSKNKDDDFDDLWD